MKLKNYTRQIKFVGKCNQRILRDTSVVIVGCGAIGSMVAESLSRSGIINMTLIDDDIIKIHNLHRMVNCYHEDVGKSKSLVLSERFGCDGIFKKLDKNTVGLLAGFDIIIDASDNLKTRFLINKFSVDNGIPWIFSSAIRSEGMVGFFSGESPCFNCIFSGKEGEKCRTQGMINQAAWMSAIIASSEVLKFVMRQPILLNKLFIFNLFENKFDIVKLKGDGCSVCNH